jgi:long-subunit acyl-CoA synthetase (AMP-forming)
VAWAVADVALHVAGIPNVPLPSWFLDAQLCHALDDAGIDAVLTDVPDRFAAWPAFEDHGIAPGSGLRLLRRPPPPTSPWPEGTVKVTYTSGSTGTPKGIPLTSSALESVAASIVGATASLGIRRHLALLPLPTLLENVAGLHASVLAHAECVLPARTGVGAGELDVPRLLAVLGMHAPQSVILVPELLRALVIARTRGWSAPPGLAFAAVGGAAVAPDLLAEAATLGLPVYEGYGLSECASVVCLNVPGANRPGSVGRPLPHARVEVDATGEVHVRGAVAAGSTEVATGDLGEFDSDGYLHLRGRRRNVFITSLGRNVSPEWIERELLRAPEIAHALAFGESRPRPVALLAPVDPSVSDTALAVAVERANARLPEYAQVCEWARMPRLTPADGTLTPNGRPRRERVAALHAERLARLGAVSVPQQESR